MTGLPPKPKTKAIVAAGLIVLGGGWVWSRVAIETPRGTALGKVMRGDLIQRVTVAGTVVPDKKTIVTPPYNGYIRRLFVKVGDHVKPGDPIVSVAQSLLARDEEVYPLRAPIGGTVVQVLKAEGEYVETGSSNAMVRIDDTKRLLVEANAPENEIDKLKLEQDVVIKAQALLDHPYKGRIRKISLAARDQANNWEKAKVEFPIGIEILDADASLKPGMSVIIDIIASRLDKVLILRHEYIRKSGEKYFAISANGKQLPIEVGAQNEEGFEVKSGVTEGMPVRQIDFEESLTEQAGN